MKSSQLLRELESYSAILGPGYAVLIDAPWGAGKTFLIKKMDLA